MLQTHVQYSLAAQYRLPVAIEDIGDLNSSHEDRSETYTNLLGCYEEFGYVIVRKLIPSSVCDEVVSAFRREVKPFAGPLVRQASARPGPHLFTNEGFVANGLLSIQDLAEPGFNQFRTCAIHVMAGEESKKILETLLMAKPVLVESMYFESTLVGVPLHADGDYMDSDAPGILGAWFALEDIAPLAGRFVLLPRSHRLTSGADGAATAYLNFRARQAETGKSTETDIKTRIKRRLEEAAFLHAAILDSGLSLVAPAVNKGDAIFWSAGLIHGSLPPERRNQSRNSLTAHYIADSRALRVNGRRVDFKTETHHGMNLRMMRETI